MLPRVSFAVTLFALGVGGAGCGRSELDLAYQGSAICGAQTCPAGGSPGGPGTGGRQD